MAAILSASPTWAEAFTAVAEVVQRSTVQVHGDGPGGGSGVIWTADGMIVTNAHVARDTSAKVELRDGRTFDVQVVTRDTQRDLAILKIEAQDLPAAVIGNSDQIRVGELVLAAGNPLGVVGAVSVGIIHGAAGSQGPGRQEWIAADIRLAPGNSGGPLVDAQGRVLGINSMIAGGLGLAVPSNAVGELLTSLEQRPIFGVTVQPVRVPGAGEPRLGLLVLEVASDSAALDAGLMQGDLLIGVGGSAFANPGDIVRAWRRTKLGEALTLDVVRGGQPIQVLVHVALPEAVAA